jgi:hypothetical protein
MDWMLCRLIFKAYISRLGFMQEGDEIIVPAIPIPLLA